jgi:hypothetical protein
MIGVPQTSKQDVCAGARFLQAAEASRKGGEPEEAVVLA